MTTSLRLFLIALACTGATRCAKILGVMPDGGKSHHFIGSAYTKALAEAGHELTVIVAFREKNPPPNYREIVMEELYDTMLCEFFCSKCYNK